MSSDARSMIRAHMRRLMAAAALLEGANAATACGTKKDPPPTEPPEAGNDAPVDASVTVPPIFTGDPDATAESTLDSAVFAGPDAAKARADAGKRKPPNQGYTVVDPLPTPTRIKPNQQKVDCTIPYTVDAQGRKHYKPECM